MFIHACLFMHEKYPRILRKLATTKSNDSAVPEDLLCTYGAYADGDG